MYYLLQHDWVSWQLLETERIWGSYYWLKIKIKRGWSGGKKGIRGSYDQKVKNRNPVGKVVLN